MNVQIHDELRSLIPPLADAEWRQLEANILQEGCREPLVTWNSYIVDGHNRYDICTRHGIEYAVVEKEFADIDAVKVWMIDNQKGRRNLSDGWKFELAQTRKALLEPPRLERRKQNLKQYADVSTIDTSETNTGRTRDELAADLGWSTGKVAMADKVWSEADEDTKESVKSGETSINQAYTEIKKEAKKKEYEQRNELLSSKNKELETTGKYRVIYADPPWAYNDKQQISQLGGSVKHYPTMNIDELCAMPVKDIAEDNAVLFLWTTSPLLEDAFRVVSAWGFKYKTSFVWDKVKHNMGHYNSVRHEFLLICVRGSCTPDTKKLFDSVQTIEKTTHSTKPTEFYDIVETLYTTGNKIELFARNKREGWESYGNESA